MCLNNVTTKKPKIAKTDIKVFKIVRKGYTNESLKNIPNGTAFTGIIQGCDCKGVIVHYDGTVYFCTNNNKLDGCSIPVEFKFGYEYSWWLDIDVSLIVINGVELESLVTKYKGLPVNIGETYTSKLDKLNSFNEIQKGLHSYAGVSDYDFTDKRNIYCECIIPKGSKYYEGSFSGNKSYASDTLKYERILSYDEVQEMRKSL